MAYGSNCIKEVRRGYRYILTLVDSMSKLGFAFPTRSQSVGEIISILETNVLPIVNVPRELVTDAAQVFRSNLFEGFCLDNNIDHLEGVPYHSADNGLVERFHHTIENCIRACLASPNGANDWPAALPHVVRAYNSSRHSSHGYSPFYVMFGDDGDEWINEAKDENPDVEGMVSKRRVQWAQIAKGLTDLSMERERESKWERGFEVGDFVLVRSLNPGKFEDRFDKFGHIISKMESGGNKSAMTFRVRLNSGKVLKRHIKDLKKVRKFEFGSQKKIISSENSEGKMEQNEEVVDEEEIQLRANDNKEVEDEERKDIGEGEMVEEMKVMGNREKV